MDGVWRLKSEAVGELSIGRRVPSLGLFNEGPAETIFQHAIPIKLLAQQHSGGQTLFLLVETVSRARQYVTRLSVPRARRVTRVAASILPSHVHDQRFRTLRLDFKGGDERVFGVNDHVFGFAL